MGDKWRWTPPRDYADYAVMADPAAPSREDGTVFVMRMYRKDRPGWCRETIIWADGQETVNEFLDEPAKEVPFGPQAEG